MNKKLIAAIAATTMAGAVGFASVAAATEFNWYGSLRAGVVSSDDDKANSNRRLDLGATGKDGSVGGQGLYSRIGIKAKSDFGNGSSAGLHLERGVGKSSLSTRHSNVWIGGGWGKLTFGQQGNPYRNARNWDQSWFLGGQFGFNDGGTRIEGLRYDLATGPFSLSIMATANDNEDKLSDAETTTIHYYTNEPFFSPAALRVVDMQKDAPLFISGTTDADGKFTPGDTQTACTMIGDECAIAYTLVDADTNGISRPVLPSKLTRARTDVAKGGKSTVKREDGIDSWILAFGYDFGPVNLNVAHRIDNTNITAVSVGELDAAGRSSDNTAIGLNGSAGPFGWYVSYQMSSDNAKAFKNDVDSLGGYASFALSDNDKLYLYHVSHDADRQTWERDDKTFKVSLGTDVTETILGYSHSFGGGVSFIGEYLQIDKGLPSGTKGSDPNVLALALKVDF
ncbi:porin [Candidatus Spongiihabitans sp.]|uniref:porin n=1 Tax=Candidatus Spongiihabitans sp. TaxID=3101308 RepID=UPI003C6F5C2A